MMDESLLQEFVEESREHLESIEPDLLELERSGENTSDETINSVFRAIHSIKGASGFFGFENLKHFSHVMESVFMMIRDKTLSPSPSIVDVLLKGIDRLSEMVNDINNSESVNVADEQAKLEAILNSSFDADDNADDSTSEPSAEVAPAEESEFQKPAETTGDCPFDLNTPAVEHSVTTGQILYAITVYPKKDFSDTTPIAMLENLATVGELHQACTPHGENLVIDELPAHLDGETSSYETVHLLYGSVLEISLVPAALNLPEDQVVEAKDFKVSSLNENAAEAENTEVPDNTNNPFNFDADNVIHAKTGGQFLYVLAVKPEDFADKPVEGFIGTLSTVGTFLEGYTASKQSLTGQALSDELNNLAETTYILYASVLEEMLIPATSGLAESAIWPATTFTLPEGTPEPSPQQAPPQVTTPELIKPNKPVEVSTEHAAPPAKEPPSKTPATKSSSSGTSQESIRVRVDLLNRLMNLAGEMVLLRNQLTQKLANESSQVDGLGTVLQNINHTTTELQEHIMQTRMQPIGNVFNKFHRVVRDIARSLEKEIDIEISGNEVELDKSIVENLSDPLTHLIRNSCDHGVEPPDERVKANKPQQGKINLRAFQEGGQIIIAIQDDGRGIDAEKLTEKAIEKGVITQAEADRMSLKEKVNLIFHPGFSTAAKISDVSGRGVGMDVVKTNIEKLGGTIEVDTEVGMGTIIHLHLPLTLAIIPSLVVGVQEHQLAIPQINVVELINVRKDDVPKKIETVGSASVFRLRGKLLPLVKLSDVLGLTKTYTDPVTGEERDDRRLSLSERRQLMEHPEVEFAEDGRMMLPRDNDSGDRRAEPYQDLNIAVLKLGGKQYGLVVDHVRNLEEIVVKPLSQYLQGCKCYAGSTIMGDGSVTMILDVGGVAEQARLDFSKVEKEEDNREKADKAFTRNGSVEMDIILFALSNDDDADQFAVPLQQVLRLEKFALENIQLVGNKEYLTYQGHSLPLIRIDEHLPLDKHSKDTDEKEAYLILPRPKDGEREGQAAIIANRIVDVDTIAVTLESSHMKHPGVRGSAVVNDVITTFIEPEGFINANTPSLSQGSQPIHIAFPG